MEYTLHREPEEAKIRSYQLYLKNCTNCIAMRIMTSPT